MITAANLAGFFAAHAIWCVSEQDGLVPMLAFSDENGDRKMERLAFDDTMAAVEHGRQRMADDPFSASDGVLVYDARITLGEGKLDAIMLEMRSYAFPDAEATIAVPYTPCSSGRFQVHRPKVVEWQNCEDFDVEAVMEGFFQGVEAHEQGAKVWEAALDESK